MKTDIHFNRLMPGVKVVAQGLVDREILEERRTKRYGLVPVPIYPAKDLALRQEMRERLGAVLMGSSEPQGLDAALFLLTAEELINGMVPDDRRPDAKKRASDIIAEASPEGSFLRGYAAARAKDFWRASPDIQHWFDF